MIEVIGVEQSPEADAANNIKQAIIRAWPWVENDIETKIHIIPSAQCHGENTRDIDIVLLALLPIDKACFQPFVPLKTFNDEIVEPAKVHVYSLCIAIEVKDHDPANIRFQGTKVEVLYYSNNVQNWHCVTQQSKNQKYSLKNYLSHHISPNLIPYIVNLIWLRNVLPENLPRGPHNILHANLSWNGLLNTIAQNMKLRKENNKYILSSTALQCSFPFAVSSELLCLKIEPTRLDRARMDRIFKTEIRDSWLEDLKNSKLIFEGRGGTGKTMLLLSLAWRLRNQQKARIIILTYNLALVADLRRLLAMMGLSDEDDASNIEIQTVHHFLYQIFKTLGILDETEEKYLENYEKYKKTALEMFSCGAIKENDILEMNNKDPENFLWDYIFIDEGQDWPSNERDLLQSLYSESRFVIADGMDQLVRFDQNCDWSQGPVSRGVCSIHLERGLRMKRNIAQFVNAYAAEMGLNSWSIEENPSAIGGRIIIIQGNYFSDLSIHESLIEDALKSGNMPIDMLMCIPPSMVEKIQGERITRHIELLKSKGYKVWDGTSRDIRLTYPTSVQQLRIVQYDSCRGLEGWTVINLAIDKFYEYKLASWKAPQNIETLLFSDDQLPAKRFATRWMLIPLSRAIDTLVLNIVSESSAVGIVLKKLFPRFRDFIDWRVIKEVKNG